MLRNTITLLCIAASALLLPSCKKETPVETYTEQKILVLGNSNEPQGLDPQTVTGVVESNIIRSIFEGLCMDHPNDPAKHSPGAAESWTSTPDSKEWTFKLHKDGKWSDGTPVTAHDFVFAYHRILHPNFGAKYASMLYFIDGAENYNKNYRELYLIKKLPIWEQAKTVNFRGNSKLKADKYIREFFEDLSTGEKQYDIEAKGLNSVSLEQLQAIKTDLNLFNWPKDLSNEVKNQIIDIYINNHATDLWTIADIGVKAVDDYTLQIELKAPTPFLPDITKHYTWYPVPKHIISKLDEPFKKNYKWTEPGTLVSNGPFLLTDWKFNDFIQVDKNPHYWDIGNVKLNGIRFLPVSNAYTEARMFFNDQLHATDTLAPELIEYAKKKQPDAVRQETYLGTNFLRLNVTLPELEDRNLRMALAYSIDSKSIIDYILKGGQQPATGMVPPMGAYQHAEVFKFDPELAKEFFAKTKFASNPKDLKLTFVTTDKETAKVLAETIQEMWNTHLGIDVEISQSDWKTYLGKLSKLDYGVATGGWIGDYPDPTTFLDMWKTGDGNNRTGWSNESYEAKLREAEQTADPLTRLKLLQEAEAIFLADSPVIPLYWYTKNYVLHGSVKGWKPSIMKTQPYKFMSLQN